MIAYGDCARAIYQSWGVIGLGLASFALSSFIPTQRFGVLMFVMLTVSSIGNLVLLPALLAGPAGWFFWRKGEKLMQAKSKAAKELAVPEERTDEVAEELVAATESVTIPMVSAMEEHGPTTRRDRPHRRPTRK